MFIYYRPIVLYMSTTIQIDNETHEILSKLRKSLHAESYNEVIKILLKKGLHKSRSMYGFLGKMSSKVILKDLRDKSDRI